MSFGFQGLKNAFSVASLIGQDIVARSISLTQAAALNAITLVTGARIKFSSSANDFVSSDGTTVTFAGTGAAGVAVTGTLAAGNNNFNVNGATGAITLSGGTTVGNTIALAANAKYGVTANAVYNTAPTISAGFGAGASVVASNGSIAFTVNTGAASASGTIGLPAAATGWVVLCQNITTNDANHAQTKMISSTTTTAVIGNYTSGGVSGNWGANDVIACIAIAF